MKGYLFFMVVLIITVIAGCAKQEESLAATNFKQGYGELTFEFTDRAFPQEVYQNSPLSFALGVENNAAYDLQDITINIVGFDRSYIDLSPSEQKLELLEGKSILNPRGGKEILFFQGNVRALLQGVEYLPQNYIVHAKYRSTVEFSPTVCLNPNIYQVYDAGCTMPSSIITFNGQGAPLSIKSMDQITRSGFAPEVEFRLSLQNKGKGELQKITLRQARLGNEAISCQFRDTENKQEIKITLDNKNDLNIVCTKQIEDQHSYRTTIFLALEYEYELSVPRNLKILR